MSKTQNIFNQARESNQKKLAVLIDPDKVNSDKLNIVTNKLNQAKVDFVFIGGSLLVNDNFENTIHQ